MRRLCLSNPSCAPELGVCKFQKRISDQTISDRDREESPVTPPDPWWAVPTSQKINFFPFWSQAVGKTTRRSDRKPAFRPNRALAALRFGRFAKRLAMFLQKQKRPLPGLRRTRHLKLNGFLSLSVDHAIVQAYIPALNPNQNMGTIGRYGCQRTHPAEQKNSVRARVPDVRELLQGCPFRRTAEVTAKLMLHTLRDLFQSQRAQFGHHATRLQRRCQRLRAGGQQFRRTDPDLLQLLPPTRAADIARRVPAMPPDEELIGINRPRRLLRTVMALQPVE